MTYFMTSFMRSFQEVTTPYERRFKKFIKDVFLLLTFIYYYYLLLYIFRVHLKIYICVNILA